MKSPNSIFFNTEIFSYVKFEICAYTQLQSKIKKQKNIPQGWCATPPSVPVVSLAEIFIFLLYYLYIINYY